MNATTVGNKTILEFELGEFNKKLVDMMITMELAKKSDTSEKDIRELAYDIKRSWWQTNKHRFLNENNR